jgi:uncharacterized membrane-anchored protein
MSRFKRNIRLFIAAIAVVFIWRGVWSLLDILLIDIDPTVANIALVFVGLIILIIDDLELFELRNKRERKEK